MADYREVLKNISNLESMLPGIIHFDKPNFKAIWNQIKITGESFKGTRFPSNEEHEQAWNKFQKIIDNVRILQEEDKKRWEEKKRQSNRFKDMIVSQAIDARPYDTALADLILTFATGGINILLEAIMGPFDEERDMLLSCNQKVKKGWNMLSKYKKDMLGKDKNEAYQELIKTNELLDSRWNRYKIERQKAFEKYKNEKERKIYEREQRIQKNIENLKSRRDKLMDVLNHKKRHIDELHDKLSDAKSDEFRQRVSGWISEEQSRIIDIQDKIYQIESWIDDDKSKLS